jgi:hypothetical protein
VHKLMVWTCVLFTLLAVMVAARIEYLNVHAGYFLPRQPSDLMLPTWRTLSPEDAKEILEGRIYEQREQLNASFAPGDDGPSVAPSYGPPYSDLEKGYMERMLSMHDSHNRLHWWVSTFGVLQYFLAPIALFIAIACVVSVASYWVKSAAGLCALLDTACVLLMLTRGYWHALGVDMSGA